MKDKIKSMMPQYMQLQHGISDLRRPFRCLNPEHSDEHPSMRYDSKRQRLHCFSCGCDVDVFGLIGMDYGLSDFRDQMAKAAEILKVDTQDTGAGAARKRVDPKKTVREWLLKIEPEAQIEKVSRYEYKGVDGSTVFTKFRLDYLENGRKKKKFFSGIVKGNGYFNTKSEKPPGVYGSWPLDVGKLVYIVEGEKCCDICREHGLQAITTGSSSTAATWEYFREYFTGADIVILQDNDNPGRKYASETASILSATAKSVKIVTPCENRKGGDITDFFEAGGTVEQLLQMIEKVDANPAPVPETKNMYRDTLSNGASAISARLVDLKPETAPLNDVGASLIFSDVFADRHRYNVSSRDWMFFDGRRWIEDCEGMEAARSSKRLWRALMMYGLNIQDEQIQRNFLDFALSWSKAAKRQTILRDARDNNYFSSEQLDSDPLLLNVQNGVLKLSLDGTATILPHNPDLLISKIANVTYDPQARCRRWEQFLDEVMQKDGEKISYIQKLAGLCLSGITRDEKLWFLYGSSTRNGKSTLLETLASLLGDYSVSIRPETLATKSNPDSRQASPDLAKLRGARLALASEFPRRMSLDVGLVKQLTGGDTISCRQLYQREMQFRPQFKLVSNTNYLPLVSDPTLFASDRVQVIEFNRHFGAKERDLQLKPYLLQPDNLSGILNWALDGWAKYCAEGLLEPEVISRANAEFAASSDKIKSFFEDCLCPSENSNIAVKDLYPKYERWCSENGFCVENKQNFIADLKSKKVFVDRGMVNKKQVRNIVKGYCFQEETFRPLQTQSPFD